MIVRELPDRRLLCIHQTTHAWLAAQFCRHWGNADFAPPTPYAAVMLGIAQHDTGWAEWESQPEINPDGSPMAFYHGPAGEAKRALWQRGIDRAASQHPYAGLLVARHAALLYENDLPHLPPDEQAALHAFLRNQNAFLERTRKAWAHDPVYAPALAEEALLANLWLLEFGDIASLHVCMGRTPARTLVHCPVDGRGLYTDISMHVEGDGITFSPWPFGVDEFAVEVHGRLLDQAHFPSAAAYHAALAAAPLYRLTWRVHVAAE